jgi:hypothetical protein
VATEAVGSLMRISHRVPLVGVVVAVACGAGWIWLRNDPRVWIQWLALALGVVGGIFLFLAIVGLLRNLFEPADRRKG